MRFQLLLQGIDLFRERLLCLPGGIQPLAHFLFFSGQLLCLFLDCPVFLLQLLVAAGSLRRLFLLPGQLNAGRILRDQQPLYLHAGGVIFCPQGISSGFERLDPLR